MRSTAAVSLGGLCALHILWATGSAWPAPNRATLADAVGGFCEFPGAGACLGVATLLALSACCVAGTPQRAAGIARLGSAATSLVLLVRASAGLAGWMPNGRRSRAFAELDRRVYSPVCLAIAIMASAGIGAKPRA